MSPASKHALLHQAHLPFVGAGGGTSSCKCYVICSSVNRDSSIMVSFPFAIGARSNGSSLAGFVASPALATGCDYRTSSGHPAYTQIMLVLVFGLLKSREFHKTTLHCWKQGILIRVELRPPLLLQNCLYLSPLGHRCGCLRGHLEKGSRKGI